MVTTAAAYADGVRIEDPIATLARRPDETLAPDRNIAEAMQVFDRLGVDELAVVDAHGAVLGIVTETHLRRRYADELERAQRELFGEAQ